MTWGTACTLCLLSFIAFGGVVALTPNEADARRACWAMGVSGFLGILCFMMIVTS